MSFDGDKLPGFERVNADLSQDSGVGGSGLLDGFSAELDHHQMPNFAAILPDYSNREQEYIQQAFSVTSFVMVRDLPTRIRPSATNRAMAAKIDANRRSIVQPLEERQKVGVWRGCAEKGAQH